jgi:butyryl-CoA dehydrogenase
MMRDSLSDAGDLQTIATQARDGIDHLERATDWLIDTLAADKVRSLAAAAPYLALFGTSAGGWLLARSAFAARRRQAAGRGNHDDLDAKRAVAGFYAANLLPQAGALAAAVIGGGDGALFLAEDQF